MILKKVKAANQGFTIVETLVAITILLVGVLGPLSIAANGIADGMFAKNQLTANYLAQEAIEMVINKRDSNADARLPAFGGIPTPCVPTCTIDLQTGDIASGDIPQLVFDKSTGLFADAASVGSADKLSAVFSRKIDIDCDGPPATVCKITVTIDWQNKDNPRQLVIRDFIYASP